MISPSKEVLIIETGITLVQGPLSRITEGISTQGKTITMKVVEVEQWAVPKERGTDSSSSSEAGQERSPRGRFISNEASIRIEGATAITIRSREDPAAMAEADRGSSTI